MPSHQEPMEKSDADAKHIQDLTSRVEKLEEIDCIENKRKETIEKGDGTSIVENFNKLRTEKDNISKHMIMLGHNETSWIKFMKIMDKFKEMKEPMDKLQKTIVMA